MPALRNRPPPRRGPTALSALPASLLAILILFPACSADGPPEPALAPEQARDNIAAAMRALSSARFAVWHEEGGTDLGFGTLTRAEGDGLFPDRARFVATTTAPQFGGVTLEFDIIQHGGSAFIRDRISNRWQTIPPGTLLISFADVTSAIADGIAAMNDPQLSFDAPGGDGNAFLLSGSIDAVALAGLVPSAPAGSILDLQIRAQRDDFLVRRVSVAGVLLPGDPPSTTRILELSEFGKPLTIEPPL